MQPHYEAIRAAGGDVLVVSMTQPEFLRDYLQRTNWSFEVVGDPHREAYRLFGLERTAVSTYFRPSVLAGYLRLMFRGWRLRAPIKGEDVHQLGGDFVLDEQRRVIFAHRSKDPTDRPAATEVMKLFTPRAS